MITVAEFEEKVWFVEGVRVIIRAPQEDAVQDYAYSRKFPDASNVDSWTKRRIKPLLDGKSFSIIDGSGVFPHKNISMDILRKSYTHSDED